ncbi:MAG: SDR family NAD(P)-dependent oxidoreductase [bacterium]
MELTNKVALVTGGARRVGKAIAVGLAKEGMAIALHYHKSDQQAEETVAQLHALGAEVLPVKGDFSNVAEINRVVQTCVEHFKQLNVLINNAAVYIKTPVGRATEKDWDKLLDVNLKAVYFCAQAVSAIMKKQKSGKIINIADVAGIDPWPDFIPYSASKAGVIAVTKGLAKALAPDIQVNAIASGTVLMSEDATENYTDHIKDMTLLKRIGTPDDVVNTVLFLLKGTDFVTGEVVAVDGGRLLR